MKQHKWHKEIKAWADGIEVEFKVNGEGKWKLLKGFPYWDCKNDLFRIKPQIIEKIKLEVEDGN